MLNPPPEQQPPPPETGPQDGRKVYGKRELSTSKRAAQNRAAQVRVDGQGHLPLRKVTDWSSERSVNAKKGTSASWRSR